MNSTLFALNNLKNSPLELSKIRTVKAEDIVLNTKELSIYGITALYRALDNLDNSIISVKKALGDNKVNWLDVIHGYNTINSISKIILEKERIKKELNDLQEHEIIKIGKRFGSTVFLIASLFVNIERTENKRGIDNSVKLVETFIKETPTVKGLFTEDGITTDLMLSLINIFQPIYSKMSDVIDELNDMTKEEWIELGAKIIELILNIL